MANLFIRFPFNILSVALFGVLRSTCRSSRSLVHLHHRSYTRVPLRAIEDRMILFMMAALFARTIDVVPNPVDLGTTWIEVVAQETLVVKNAGAQIELDVTDMLDATARVSTSRLWKELPAQFPRGTVTAVLVSRDGAATVNLLDGQFAVTDERSFILLTGSNLKKGMEFTKVRLMSKKPLAGIRIRWRNATK